MPRDPASSPSPSPSDDDDDDQEDTLLPQHDAPKPPSSAFRIAAAAIPFPSPAKHRCLILAVCLPLLLLLLFFSLRLGPAFSSLLPASIAPSVPQAAASASASDRMMREAELRALFLLRDQHLALMRLWNGSNASDSFKSALLQQLSLNRRIRDVLLSAHRAAANLSRSLSLSPSPSPSDQGFDLDYASPSEICRKTPAPSDRRTVEWRPRKDRFLLAVCLSGQMSNHLLCLEKHMFFAALLGRTLVLPSPRLDYDYARVLDLPRINRCFGRTVVLPFDDYEQQHRGRVHVDRFICYMASPPCFLDDDHLRKLRSAGVSTGSKLEPAWPEDAKSKDPKKRSAGDILPKFSSDEELIAVGDLFYADVDDERVMQPGGPLKHTCRTVLQPSRLIVLTAQRFVQTFLGGNFVALHFRRHGFLKFCNAKQESCFFPIPQAAECLRRVVEEAGSPVVYLSTDAADSETLLLQKLLKLNGEEVPLVRRPEHTSAEKWDALVYRSHMGGDAQVEAMLDKTICAMAKVFVGSAGSTFTEDILRLRRGWGSATSCDQYLCQGHLPDFIADAD